MKNVTCTTIKPYFVISCVPNPGTISAYTFFDEEAQAKDFAARAVATAKGGEAMIGKITEVCKLPQPDTRRPVTWADPDVTWNKAEETVSPASAYSTRRT